MTRQVTLDTDVIEDIGLTLKNAAGAAFVLGESIEHDDAKSNAAFLLSRVLNAARDDLYRAVFGDAPGERRERGADAGMVS